MKSPRPGLSLGADFEGSKEARSSKIRVHSSLWNSRLRFSVTAPGVPSLLLRLGVICLFVMAVTFPAHADTLTTYTIDFTTTSGIAPTGSFTYDSTTGTFSNFLVMWAGDTFDLTAAANGVLIIGTGTGCNGESSTGSYGFAILSQTLTGCAPTLGWIAYPEDGFSEFVIYATTSTPSGGTVGDYINAGTYSNNYPPVSTGTWTIPFTAVPEPTPWMLLGAGLLALAVAQRRKRPA